MQFQVGEIIACEEVKKSKKLLCSQVKVGSQVKQIVSGIKATLQTGRDGRQESHRACQPETSEARAGVLSEGMLLLRQKTQMAVSH